MSQPGQSIFMNDSANSMNNENMMRMFSQMMAMMSSQSGLDLENFYKNKVQDMNQFYHQLQNKSDDCYLQQSSQFVQRSDCYDPQKYQEDLKQHDPKNHYGDTKRKLQFPDDVKNNSNFPQKHHDSYAHNEFANEFNDHDDEDLYSKYKHKQQTDKNLKQQPHSKNSKPTHDLNGESIQPQRADIHNFDDIPIRSAKASAQIFDDQPLKSNKNKPSDDYKLDRQNNHFDEIPIRPARQNNHFDEIPIKPQRSTNQFDEMPIKPARQPNPYDEIPIKPMRQQNPVSQDEQPISRISAYDQKTHPSNPYDEQPIRPAKRVAETKTEVPPSKTVQPPPSFDEIPIKTKQPISSFDEQPIRPAKKNIQEDVPIKPSRQVNHDDSPNQRDAKPKKSFLKKGTRQFLSNAQQRSEIAKKEIDEIMKENNALAQGPPARNASKPAKEIPKYTETNLYPTKPQANSNKRESQAPKRQQEKLKTTVEQPQGQFEKLSQTEKQHQQSQRDFSQFNESQSEYQFDDNEDWGGPTQQPSKLTEKYFGKGSKNDKPPNKGKGQKDQKDSKESSITLTQEKEEEIVRKYVQEKIDSLNAEIQKFKAENDRVRKAKIKYEDQLKQLNREREEWEKAKELEKLQLEEWKEEEKKKIIREKRVQERQAKTFQNMPNRKEREEIDALKKQIEKMTEDSKAREQKNKLNYERMKKQCEDLTQRNHELQQEIKALELRMIEQKKPGGSSVLEEKRNLQQTQQILQNQQKSSQQLKQLPGNLLSQNESKSAKKIAQPVTQKKAQIIASESENEENEEQASNSDGGNSARESETEEYDYEDIVVKSEKKHGQNNLKSSGMINAHNGPGNAGQNPVAFQNKPKKQQPRCDLVEMQEQGIPFSIKHINQIISESEFCYDQNRYYMNYKKQKDIPMKITSQNVGPDGKVQRVYQNGKKEVIFHNGVKREVFQDGYIVVHFMNKDVKQTLPNGTVIYYFADANTTQITITNGPNIYRFANQQIEIHFTDGTKEIRFGDGTEKYILPTGEEETFFSDGIHQIIDVNKVKHIEYPNGNVDIIYPDGQKQRQYKKPNQ